MLFGCVPIAWIVGHQGLSAPGTLVVEFRQSAARFQRWAYIGWITVKNTPVPVLLLAAIGLWRGRLNDSRLRMMAVFLGIFLLAILFSAHGEAPDPERYVTSREAVLPIAATMLLVALGLEHVRPRWGFALAILGFCWCLLDAHRVLRRDTADPHIQLSYQLAQYLDQNLGPGERALIVAKPVTPDMYQAYFDRIRHQQGQAGVEHAFQLMAGINASPLDCWRTIVHSSLGPARFSCTDREAAPWVAVWSDSGGASPEDGTLRAMLRSGSLIVRVYRRAGIPAGP